MELTVKEQNVFNLLLALLNNKNFNPKVDASDLVEDEAGELMIVDEFVMPFNTKMHKKITGLNINPKSIKRYSIKDGDELYIKNAYLFYDKFKNYEFDS